jgi:hypothetical protein
MAIERGFRFPIEQDVAFPRGLVLMGEIEPDNEYQSAEDRGRNRPVVQRKDERTGKLVWKGTLTDPSEKRSKRAAFDVRFVAAVQPVPTTDEVIPGMRPIELDGLEVEPKVGGQGEYKYLTYEVWATGIKDSGRGRAKGSGSASSAGGSASSPAAA